MLAAFAALAVLLMAIRPEFGATGFVWRAAPGPSLGDLEGTDLDAWRENELVVLSRIALGEYRLLGQVTTLQISRPRDGPPYARDKPTLPARLA